MKRITLVVCMALLITCCFVACNNNHTHEATFHEQVSPTCTESGTMAYYECNKCHKKFSDSECTKELSSVELPAQGHTYSPKWSKDENYHWHEATCGHSEAVNKVPHNFVKGICECGMSNGEEYFDIAGKFMLYHTPEVEDDVPQVIKNVYFELNDDGSGSYIEDYSDGRIEKPLTYTNEGRKLIINGYKTDSNGDSIPLNAAVVDGILVLDSSINSYFCSEGHTLKYSGRGAVYSYTIDNLFAIPNIDGNISIADVKSVSIQKANIPADYNDIEITQIGPNAFFDCQWLQSIVFGKNIKSIEFSAFWNCKALKTINFPAALEYVDSSAFYDCSELETITVEDGCTTYEAVDNCLIDKVNHVLVKGTKLSVIPKDKGIVTIGKQAFHGVTGLEVLEIPEGVTLLDNQSFFGASDLSVISLPSSLQRIGTLVFFDCKNLSLIRFQGTQEQWDAIVTKSNSETFLGTWDNGCGKYTIEYNG